MLYQFGNCLFSNKFIKTVYTKCLMTFSKFTVNGTTENF